MTNDDIRAFDLMETELIRVRSECPELRGMAVFEEAARRLDTKLLPAPAQGA